MSNKVKKTYHLDSALIESFENQSKEERRTFSGQLEILISKWLKSRKK